jgi:hypothetical protein
MMTGSELRLSFVLLFRGLVDKEHPTIQYVTHRVEWLHNNHYYSCQHLKIASDALKAHYDRLDNSTGLQEEEGKKKEKEKA